MTPNQVLGYIMTDDTYRDDDDKEEKKEKKDGKKKSVAFKATTSKGKAKQESSSEDEDLSLDEMDDDKMALFVKIWHFGHLNSEDRFGHNDTKLNLGRYHDQ